MTIERLKSGNYRIKQMLDHKVYCVTVKHKPTQSEAKKLISEKIAEKTIDSDMPLERAIRLYIEQKSNVLSASTIRGYKAVQRQISDSMMMAKISAISTPVLQDEINRYASEHSAKSTYNLSGFIIGVLKYYGINIRSPKLPQKEKKRDYIPSKDDIKRIFAKIKGSKYEIPILLAAMGLRRSEICALTMDDLSGNVLTINKAKVQSDTKEWVIKTTKTVDSTRTIVLPDYLVELIHERGFYDGHPELIYRTLTETQKELGIPHFSLHKMRHFFASYMHSLGYTDKQIQEAGGWKTDDIMKTVYQHAMDVDSAKKMMANDINSLI